MNVKKIFLFLIVLAFVVLTACQKRDSNGETIVVLGEETYIKPYQSFIPDSLLTKFVSQMGGVYEGYIPPNIEGVFWVDKKVLEYSNYNMNIDSHDIYFRISKQHNRTACIELLDGGPVLTDTIYIMGNENKFTLYFTEYKTMPSNETYPFIVRNVFITGEIQNDGIHNLKYGTILTDVPEVTNPYVQNFEPGHYFIYKDRNGVSEYEDWPENP